MQSIYLVWALNYNLFLFVWDRFSLCISEYVRAHYVNLVGISSNRRNFLCPPSTWIKGTCHYTQLLLYFIKKKNKTSLRSFRFRDLEWIHFWNITHQLLYKGFGMENCNLKTLLWINYLYKKWMWNLFFLNAIALVIVLICC